jgi:ribonuclease HII
MATPHKRTRCTGTLERRLHDQGFVRVAGVDEVGRGALFGAVFAGAAILSPDRPIPGLRDSKVLEAERREELAAKIRERAVAWATAAADACEIDRINILEASRLAMRRAVLKLEPAPCHLLVDALAIDLDLPQEAVIHGDARCQCIAAASILAKVERDACIRRWAEVFPQYGLDSNKGYAAPEHLAALAAHGPTGLHRYSFLPVREASPVELWRGYGTSHYQQELFPAETGTFFLEETRA